MRCKTTAMEINIPTGWTQALSREERNSVIHICNYGHVIVGSFSAHFPVLLGKRWLRSEEGAKQTAGWGVGVCWW